MQSIPASPAPRKFIYNRQRAVQYAHRWAYGRNPRFANFDSMGGDCTNFVSQCIYAGCGLMNYTPTYGWYYISLDNRTPSWSGVEFLYNFLTSNTGAGPRAKEVPIESIMPGDVIQLSFNGTLFKHSLFVVRTGRVPSMDNILVTTHTVNSDNRPLYDYHWKKIRYLHIY